ncbi:MULTISPECIES: cytochrome c-type biogenesis protein [Yoonia]|jgi:cytochrome c-type biogenesis protein CcmH|uniref:Cytochrome c-type biogenesis protein n=1 Tax=Yoonia vestfoldensis SKA53 TaxID=314232 RepID=A3V4B7_9RHOB|nr:cytochrome c-type biogenesis protein [Yoonia vestfoldensis]EAQ07324.1 cytochrome c biogenesis family protein [Yoonia vestfoldensis SKA53]
MIRLIAIFLLVASAAFAVQPDEVLDDPVLEKRARDLSQGLRCPVCRNESIDESNAELSRELRILLRERLVDGDSDEQAVDFLVARYGEFVLLRPDTSGVNVVLWYAAPVMLLIALGIGWSVIRRPAVAPPELSDAEKAELQKILRS